MSTQAHPGPLRLEPTTATRETVRTDRRVPGLVLFALAAQFMTAIMLAASLAPAYDIHAGAISDLGVIRESALLFNASLVAAGVLNIVGGYGFYRSHGRPWILVMYMFAGIGAAGAGLVPLNTSEMHSIFALFAFVFFNVEAIATAAVVPGLMRLVSVLAGVVGLGYLVLMVIGDGGNPAVFGAIGHGGAERMIVYPVMLWMMAVGGYLMATPKAEPAS